MRIFFYLLSAVFVLLILDSFVFRVVDRTDGISHFEYEGSKKRNNWIVPFLITKKGEKILMPEDKDYGYTDTCELQIKRGLIFRAPVEVSIKFNGIFYNYYCSVINRTMGGIFMAVFAFSLMIYLFYELFKYGKMTYGVFASFLIILTFIIYQLVIN